MIDTTHLDGQIAALEEAHTELYSRICELKHEREQILCQAEPHQFSIGQELRVRANYRPRRDVNDFIQPGDLVRITAFVPMRMYDQEAYHIESGQTLGHMMARDLEAIAKEYVE